MDDTATAQRTGTMIRYIMIAKTTGRRTDLWCATQAPSGIGALGYSHDEAARKILPPSAILPGDWPA